MRASIVLLAVLSALTVPDAAARERPVSLTGATGSGCDGTDRVLVSVIEGRLIVTYIDHVIEAGPDADLSDHATCDLRFSVTPQPGRRFAWTGFDQMGTAEHHGGEAVLVSPEPYFVDAPDAGRPVFPITSTSWRQTRTVAEPRWSGCGRDRPFVVSAETRMSDGGTGGTGYVAMQRAELTLVWEDCQEPSIR